VIAVSDGTDLISWAVDNWAPGAVVCVASLVLGLLIRVHGVATTTYDAMRDQLAGELARIESRNERLDRDLDDAIQREREANEREREANRTRYELEYQISRLSHKVAVLEAELAQLKGS